jgi:hypothetical protein
MARFISNSAFLKHHDSDTGDIKFSFIDENDACTFNLTIGTDVFKYTHPIFDDFEPICELITAQALFRKKLKVRMDLTKRGQKFYVALMKRWFVEDVADEVVTFKNRFSPRRSSYLLRDECNLFYCITGDVALSILDPILRDYVGTYAVDFDGSSYNLVKPDLTYRFPRNALYDPFVVPLRESLTPEASLQPESYLNEKGEIICSCSNCVQDPNNTLPVLQFSYDEVDHGSHISSPIEENELNKLLADLAPALLDQIISEDEDIDMEWKS